MRIVESLSTTADESANTSTMRQQLANSLRANKEYRHAFLEEAIRTRLAAQIRSTREDRYHWDYKKFAEKLGKKPSWVYRLEDPNAPTPTVATLLQVAEALDVALDVRLVPFSTVVDDVTTLRSDSFSVVPCEDDPGLLDRKEPHNALSPAIARTLALLGTSAKADHIAGVQSLPRLTKATPGLVSSGSASPWQNIEAAARAKGINIVQPSPRQLPLNLTPNVPPEVQVLKPRMYA